MLVAIAFLAQAYEPDVVRVAVSGNWMVPTSLGVVYHEGQEVFMLAAQKHSVREVLLGTSPGSIYSRLVPLRAPAGELLVMSYEPPGLYGTLACVDVVSGLAIASEGCGYWTSTDIDGDGWDDPSGGGMGVVWQALQRGDSFDSIRFEGPGRVAHPLPDLDADGYADLLTMEYLYGEIPPDPNYPSYGTTSYYEALSSTTRLYRGSPAGYVQTPAFALEHDRVLEFPTPIQLDQDPELEVLALASTLDFFYREDTALVALDLSDTPPTLTVLQAPFVSDILHDDDGIFSLHLVDDVDHDGIDDLVVAYDDMQRLLGSTSDFSWDDALFSFQTLPSRTDVSIQHVESITYDLDGDGLRDVLTVWRDRESTLVVTFAPFLEPPLVVPPTGDTGASPDTADPATSPSGSQRPADRCGCQSTAIGGSCLSPSCSVGDVWRRAHDLDFLEQVPAVPSSTKAPWRDTVPLRVRPDDLYIGNDTDRTSGLARRRLLGVRRHQPRPDRIRG